MEKYEIEKLRDLSIVGVAQRLGLQVNSHRKCLCPFHDDHHPSMSLGRNNQYRCFVCDAHGDNISLVQRYLNKSFLDSCKWLADESNIILTEYKPKEEKPPKPFDVGRYERFFERPWLNDEARRFLFEERRLDPRVVRWCRLTSWKDKQGVPWLQTPYYNRDGKLIGIQNRNLVKGATPRFRFPQGAECNIYNLPVLNLLKPGEALYITEGCSDCWAMLSAGHKAIAIPSATLLSKKDKELLESLRHGTQFEMWPDNDAPGERLFLQLKEILPGIVHHQLPPGCKDFSDYYLINISQKGQSPL
jgi:DNA primase